MSEGARFGTLKRQSYRYLSTPRQLFVVLMAPRRRCAHLSGVIARLIFPSSYLHRSRRQRHAQIYLFDCGSLFNGCRRRKSLALSWSERPARSSRIDSKLPGKALEERERNPCHAPPHSSALSRALRSMCASASSRALSRAVGAAAQSPASRRPAGIAAGCRGAGDRAASRMTKRSACRRHALCLRPGRR